MEVGVIIGSRALVPVAPFMDSALIINMVVFGLGLSLGGLDLHQGMAGAPSIMVVVVIGLIRALTTVRVRTAPLYWIRGFDQVRAIMDLDPTRPPILINQDPNTKFN